MSFLVKYVENITTTANVLNVLSVLRWAIHTVTRKLTWGYAGDCIKENIMEDHTESWRRGLSKIINSGDIQIPEGAEWTTDQLTEEFEVIGFLAPFVSVRHRGTGKKGTMMFRHHPRIYFGYTED